MTTLYVDGACKNNHKRTALRAAGIGVYVDVVREREPRALPAAPTDEQNAILYRGQRFAWHRLRATDTQPVTNNRAELKAVCVALRLLLEGQVPCDDEPITIVNDSQLVHNTIIKWLPGWRRCQYRKADGQPVANGDLVRELDTLLQRAHHLRIEWRHVNSHRAEPADRASAAWRDWHGNDVADRLANLASTGSTAPTAPPKRAQAKRKRAGSGAPSRKRAGSGAPSRTSAAQAVESRTSAAQAVESRE